MISNGELTCCDCLNWEPNSPETGYCGVPEISQSFVSYLEQCRSQNIEADASDCAGFEFADEGDRFALPPKAGRLTWIAQLQQE